MSANFDSSHFLYGVENEALLCLYLVFIFQPIIAPPDGRGLHRCLNFWGVGIGLLLWEVSGLGLFFPCVPPLCSLSDHFLLLSVHKYKKKRTYV